MQKTMLMSEHSVYNPADNSVHNIRQALILLKDTTELHALEHEEQEWLRAAFDEANAANKAKTEFLNRVSHDIRTPINGIMGMLEIIHKNRAMRARSMTVLTRYRCRRNICLRLSMMCWI